MDSGTLITLEMAGVLGVVLGLGGWELYRLRRDMARDARRDSKDDTQAATPDPDPGGLNPGKPPSTGSSETSER